MITTSDSYDQESLCCCTSLVLTTVATLSFSILSARFVAADMRVTILICCDSVYDSCCSACAVASLVRVALFLRTSPLWQIVRNGKKQQS